MTATEERTRPVGRPSAEVLIARAEALVPTLRERARECEELRRVPDETMRDLHESGLFDLVAPAGVGGYGYGMREFGTITRILAQGCASTAWVYSFLVVQDLDALAADCRSSSTWSCLLTSAPLPVPGGVGSPANAVAIR